MIWRFGDEGSGMIADALLVFCKLVAKQSSVRRLACKLIGLAGRGVRV